eukprot:CAMPEP_0119318586 /NCGR_PEP_ID=MMETSP1333-20130426/46861_1 /TAXON_ID=418940 /ORGANISM="Scyphosphaera apsteinii, Strain RCC1455" /LENGTH=399 /DNA_ID=CAMNT_0007324801 /DNA_START=115 /DNA_END=1314 /DNA_ORIENTATION=+
MLAACSAWAACTCGLLAVHPTTLPLVIQGGRVQHASVGMKLQSTHSRPRKRDRLLAIFKRMTSLRRKEPTTATSGGPSAVIKLPSKPSVSSWYDTGVRLTSAALSTAPLFAPPTHTPAVTSWYDGGLRLTLSPTKSTPHTPSAEKLVQLKHAGREIIARREQIRVAGALRQKLATLHAEGRESLARRQHLQVAAPAALARLKALHLKQEGSHTVEMREERRAQCDKALRLLRLRQEGQMAIGERRSRCSAAGAAILKAPKLPNCDSDGDASDSDISDSDIANAAALADDAELELSDVELSDEKNMLQQIKDAGVAGAISYAAWELAFWTISVPLCIFGYREVMGHWPDFTDQDDLTKLGAEAFGFVNVARFAVPLRIGLALSTTPWIQLNVVNRFSKKQ